MNELIKQLKRLKNIEPNEAFTRRSKFLILQNQKPEISVSLLANFWNIALTLGTLGILIIISGSVTSRNLALAGLVDTKLQEEMNFLSKKIEEPSINYYTNSNQVVVKALDEISYDKTNHLNARILEKEIKELNIENPINNKIDGLLDNLSQ